MKNADLLKRIEELERQVRELQARPVYIPVYPPPTVIPSPWYSPPQWQLPQIWCDTAAASPASSGPMALS